MALQLSMSKLLADLASDGATIGFDLPGGLYDRLHAFITERGVLPQSQRGRLGVVAALVIASRVVEQQFGTLSPLSRFAHNVSSDAVREEAKRILESSDEAVRTTSSDQRIGLWSIDEVTRRKLAAHLDSLPSEQQDKMRLTMIRATAQELAIMANMNKEDVAVLLRLLGPEPHQETTGKA